MQVLNRKCQIFGKGAIFLKDAQYPSFLAVGTHTTAAAGACAATDVDFANDALPYQVGLCLAHLHLADKFVAGHPLEALVPLLKLQVGIANPCAEDADERLTG